MSDQDIWKNYQDYNPAVPDTQQIKDDREMKLTISLSVTLPVVSLIFIALAIKFRVKIRLRLSTWFSRIWETISGLFRNVEIDPRISMVLEPSIEPSIEFPDSPGSTVYPASSESITPLPNRYLTTRPVHRIQSSAERRDRNVSRIIQRMFEVPLPQFEFADDSTYVSEPHEDIRISTPIPAGVTFTVESPTSESSTVDPAGLLETPIDSPANTLGLGDVSDGSVLAIGDFPVRNQPPRATRNQLPIYIDPAEDDL